MTANHEHTPTWDRVREHYYLGRQQFDDPLFPAGGVTEIVAEFDRWYQAEIDAAEQHGAKRAEQAIYELTEAIRLTVEYVGNDTLPPINGWTWFDALRKYRPELAEHFERNPQLKSGNHVTREIIAEQIAARLEGDDDTPTT